jgi:phospholipase/carboxylesterase
MGQDHQQIAGLDVIVQRSKNANDQAPTIIIMHGYGADHNDLAPLANILDPHGKGNWYFPNAPLEVPIGPHMTGRAWFPIDMAALELAMMAGTHRNMAGLTPEDLLKSADKITGLIQALDCPPSQLVIGGFSQGAMLACEVALHQSENVKGLVLLSATLISESRWQDAVKAHQNLAVFQSHGTNDPLLGYEQAESLKTMLGEGGCQVTFVPFTGAHEIPPVVMQRLHGFLEPLLA